LNKAPGRRGAGCGLIFAPKQKNFNVELRYGYGFNAIRNGRQGAQSVCVLFQYDLQAPKRSND
jgi:hypothetical protein